MGSVTCTLIGSFQMSACRPTTSFPTSDLREREHFWLISFEKCGESGYFIHGEVQDEVVNVLLTMHVLCIMYYCVCWLRTTDPAVYLQLRS